MMVSISYELLEFREQPVQIATSIYHAEPVLVSHVSDDTGPLPAKLSRPRLGELVSTLMVNGLDTYGQSCPSVG